MSAQARPLGGTPAAARDVGTLALVLCLTAVLGIAMVGGAAVLDEPILAFAGVALGVAALGLAILLWPDLATIVVLVLVYSNAPVIGAQFHGIPYALAALVPGLLFLPLLERVFFRREGLVLPPTLPFVVAFILVEALSTLGSRDPGTAANELGRVIGEGVLLYLLLVNTVRTLPTLRLAIVALVVTGAILASLTIFQAVTGAHDQSFLGFAQAEGRGFDPGTGAAIQERAAGPIGEKNFYAQMLLALLPLAIILLRTGGRAVRVTGAIAGVTIALGMALTYSRGAAVAVALLLPAAAFLGTLRWRNVVAVAAIGALLVLVTPNYLARLVSLGDIGQALAPAGNVDPVLAQRANDVLAAGAAFVEHPLLGVGPGMFTSVYREYASRVGGLPGDLDYAAHSMYLEVAAETGILGTLAFAGVIGATIVALFGARRAAAGRPELVAVADGFLLVVAAYLATGLFLHIAYQRYIWLFLALAAAAAPVIRSAAREADGLGRPLVR